MIWESLECMHAWALAYKLTAASGRASLGADFVFSSVAGDAAEEAIGLEDLDHSWRSDARGAILIVLEHACAQARWPDALGTNLPRPHSALCA